MMQQLVIFNWNKGIGYFHTSWSVVTDFFDSLILI